jgi:thioredoxin reductase
MENNQDFDVAIVGGGPAGLSAALMLGRSCRKVAVFDHGRYRNQAAKQLHGFLGHDGVTPDLLRRKCREELLFYNVHFSNQEVVNVTANALTQDHRTSFQLQLINGSLHQARKIIFATGMIDELPNIYGLRECYGQSVHHCPYCDAWEYRGRRIALLTQSDSIIETASLLRCWTNSIYVCTNGRVSEPDVARQLQRLGIEMRTQQIESLAHDRGTLKKIIFKDGSKLDTDALFFSSGQGQRSKLPISLGCDQDESGRYICHDKQRTSVQGVFIVGDAAEDLQFAVIAAAEGAKAAVAAHEDLLQEELAGISATLAQSIS